MTPLALGDSGVSIAATTECFHQVSSGQVWNVGLGDMFASSSAVAFFGRETPVYKWALTLTSEVSTICLLVWHVLDAFYPVGDDTFG
jgi:hypothetical protein